MKRIGKKFHTQPFILNLEKFEKLYAFLMSYADSCFIEILNITDKEKEIREFKNLEEFLLLKENITSKIYRLTLKAYKNKKKIISLEFINPTEKIFPFIDPYTLKSNFSIECADAEKNEEEYKKFILEYFEVIESLISYKRVSYKMLYAFMPSFFASVFSFVSLLPLTKQEESVLILFLVFIVIYLIYSTLVNLLLYPFLYLHNPLINFDFGLEKKRKFKIYYSPVFYFFKDNSKYLLLGLFTASTVLFFDKAFELLLK